MTKPTHNVATLSVDVSNGIKVRVTLTNGGELVIHGEDAVPVFYTIASATIDDDNEERPVH